MKKRIRSIKWLLPLYVLAACAGTLLLAFGGWAYWSSNGEWPMGSFWTEYLVAILLVGPAIGYWYARQVQRKIDALQLAIKQVVKGNLSERLPASTGDAFDAIYGDFNSMASVLESKLRLLQQFGEADVMHHLQSNQDAVLEERKRLARDLHDTVSQQLFALHMSASALPKLLELNPEAAKTVVDQLVSMSSHAQKQMRSLIAQLRPLELEDRTLEEALGKWFPDYCNQNGLQGKLEVTLHDDITEAIEHQLFLVIQEGMANVVKHAKARHVALTLYDAGHQYILKIADDGVGFDPAQSSRTSYGLSTMKERAQKLGGDAEILSRPGSGTSIQIQIPKFV